LPDDIIADFRLDCGIVHIGVIVPGSVVFPHMFETKPIKAV
jgi:hypothetical protein